MHVVAKRQAGTEDLLNVTFGRNGEPWFAASFAALFFCQDRPRADMESVLDTLTAPYSVKRALHNVRCVIGYRPEKRYVQVMVALAAVGLLAMIVLTNIARRTHDQNLFLVVNAIRLASLVLTVWIMWSWYQTRDEREKLFALQVLAMVGALVLIETMALTLVVVGSASLTAVSIFFVLVGNFVFAAFALGFRRSLLERDRHALGRMALLLSAFMAPLLWWLLTLMFPLPGMTFRTGMWVFIVAWLLISCYLAFFKATEK